MQKTLKFVSKQKARGNPDEPSSVAVVMIINGEIYAISETDYNHGASNSGRLYRKDWKRPPKVLKGVLSDLNKTYPGALKKIKVEIERQK